MSNRVHNITTLYVGLRTRSYDKDGSKRYITEIIVKNLTYGLKQNESATSNFDNGFADNDENIPF